MVRYQPKSLKEIQKELEPFEPHLFYTAYLKANPGGGKTVILVSKGSRQPGEYGPQVIDAFEMAAGVIVDLQINRAELLEYKPLGLISGHGANIWARTGEDIAKLIEVYGTPARRKSLWTRLKWRLGL